LIFFYFLFQVQLFEDIFNFGRAATYLANRRKHARRCHWWIGWGAG